VEPITPVLQLGKTNLFVTARRNKAMAPKRETALQRWGKEFAFARDAAGYTQETLAREAHVSRSVLAKWETGERPPKDLGDLGRCEAKLGTRGILKRLLKDWVSREISPEWFEWMVVEESATEMLTHEVMLIPGLLQSLSYAQTILPNENMLEQRLERQQIFERGSPPFYEALLDESVLCRRVGGPEIMAEALTHLVTMAGRDDIIVRIVPLSANLTRFAYPFVLATVESGKQLAYIQGALRGRILEGPADIAELRRLWARYGAEALSQQDSIDLIQKTINERWPVA
jgi:transcriptional regulator with XRE-family HTH domain